MSRIRPILLAYLLFAGCGDKKESVALVSADALDFGHVTCGATQVPRTFSLGNSGQVAFNFTTSFAKGTQYTVQPSSGFVLPGHQLELTVSSAAIPQVSDVTDNLYGDTLTITTDIEGDAPRELPITQTAQGAILEINDELGLPAVTPPASSTASLTVRNVGNGPATNIELTTSGAYSVAPAQIATLAAGESTSSTVTFHPFEESELPAPIELRATGLCAPPPAPTRASGTATFANAAPTAITLVTATHQGNQATLLVLLGNGTVASLGDNTAGVRGTGTVAPSPFRATLVRDADGALDQVTSITGARAAACALRTDGTTWCWGNRTLARPLDLQLATSIATPSSSGVSLLAMAYSVRCAVASADGALSCYQGARGPNLGSFAVPAIAGGARAVALVPTGGYVVNDDRTVTSFGDGARGNTDPDGAPPSLVTDLTDVVEVVGIHGRPTRRDHVGACARKTDGTVWCWGENKSGRLGSGQTHLDLNRSATPVQVMIDETTPLTGVTSIGGAHGSRCATTPTNVYCWGRGGNGRLGRSDDDQSGGDAAGNPFARPTVPAITDGISVSAMQRGACVLRATGQIVCFGETPFSDGDQVTLNDFAEAQ
jgi:hypothetical protein